MRGLKELLESRDLLVNLTLRDIRGKYRRTVLGQLWSLANPLAAMLIYTFVFSFILRLQPDRGDPSGLDVFALWLLCGLLPWAFLSNVINQGIASIVGNASLIQKVYFPRIVLPLAAVGAAGFNWLFEMAVLLIALSIVGAFVLPWIPVLLLVMILLAVFATGIALVLATANVYFRDTEYFVTILLQIWMYLTPIIYPVSLMRTASADLGGLFGTSVTVLDIYQLNPMVHFVDVFRQLLYDNRWPDPTDLLVCLVWSVASIAIGLAVFSRNQKKLAELL
ncbi:ABC-2 type transport system permease protein [Cryobacterium mesophilum]|uniref:Transport permease protein n=1 Tax=Terrimesophilobacter mesophilus TaxID=433647 RepID=A0A4R8V8N4_9MICO|nr:ABC transporter permease [Terrimesophilobacter mesophilus]MBB5631920.1 ABC-2 type transport system permease protein [Terrimesophilobacter mesophilus]TFB78825.1 ABC transporter permease [Terrimesophilobacter mesophilus]